MQVRRFSHVVLRVSDLDRSLRFYRDTLGLPVAQLANLGGRRMAFFKIGADHHDFALLEFPHARRDDPSQVGLFHVAFNVGAEEDLDALREARSKVLAAGYRVIQAIQHQVTLSVYVEDPDGLQVELYVDRSPAKYSHMNEYLGVGATPLSLGGDEQ